jgi:hypothetical protein
MAGVTGQQGICFYPSNTPDPTSGRWMFVGPCSPFLSAGRMRAAINRDEKSSNQRPLSANAGRVRLQTALPWFDNFVIKLTLFAKNDKIVTMV